MVARLSKELELNEEETVLLVRRFIDTRNEGRKLRRDRQRISQELRALVRAGEEKNAEIEDKLKSLIEVDAQLAGARTATFARLAEGLSPIKRAKLYGFMQEFEEELRKAATEMRGGRPGDGEMRRGPRPDASGPGMERRPGDGPPHGPDGEGRPRRGRPGEDAPPPPPPPKVVVPVDDLPAPPPGE